ncbi:MAG TPA: hypothetical protein VEJ38_16090 [Candidatus Acidoferrales bacterium]|nr:hypothetical protein [Candidatus Acidoferrales bacterium]
MTSTRARRAAKGFAIGCTFLAATLAVRAQSSATTPARPSTSPAAMPTAEQILDRYLVAMGGSANLKRLLSRVMTGTISVPSMQLSGTVEIHEKAPNRTLGTITINGASYRQGFDGTAGWTDDPANGLRDQTGDELAETRRESDFYHALDLHKLYSKFTLVGKEKIGERDAYVIEAALPEGGPPEKLYFDVQNGLVLRDSSQRHGPDGVSEFQQDYEDYRDVDGVKLPFTIRQTNEGTLVIITVTEYHHNVPLDDSQFVKPAAQ